MIEIIERSKCCGCNACVQACPKHCITMSERDDGFMYPTVDKEKCVDCGRCEKVCQYINECEPHKPLKVYAAQNNDEEIRRKSSSGGVFTLLAEQTIKEGGIVFGACFDDDWNIVHDSAETMEGVGRFRGSKYVQSSIGDCFQRAERQLKTGRKVLFSGTPCQIAGLKKYLRKEYANLFTVDFVCHGVPSPKVWRMYLKEETARQCGAGKNSVLSHPISPLNVRITDIQFRNKRLGWKKYSFALTLSVSETNGANTVLLCESISENLFMRGFLSDLYLRESCYACPAKSFKSHSDVTIGDLWGVNQIGLGEMDDDKGLSIMTVNSEQGESVVGEIKQNMLLSEISYEQALLSNPNLIHINKRNDRNIKCFEDKLSKYPLLEALKRYFHRSLLRCVVGRMRRYADGLMS